MNNTNTQIINTELCFLNNLSEYLNDYKLHLSAEDISIYSGLMGFFWSKIAPKKEILHGRRAPFHDLFDQLMKCIDFQIIHYNDTDNLLHDLSSKEETEALIWMNDYFLSHSVYFDTTNYASLVVIKSIEGEDIIYFDNGLKKMTINEFKKSIFLSNGVQLIKLNSISPWKKSTLEAIHSGLVEIINSFLKDDPDNAWGNQGLDAFYNSFKEEFDCENFFNIYYALNRPAGLYLTRMKMYKFLVDNYKLFQQKEYETSRDIYKLLSGEWHILGNNVFKLSKSYDHILHMRLTSRLDHIIKKEREGIISLQGLIH
jgi:hypothetical protein